MSVRDVAGEVVRGDHHALAKAGGARGVIDTDNLVVAYPRNEYPG